MRKCWGEARNDRFIVGCSGATVYIYDKDGTELAKFKDFPYAYRAVFKPGTDIIAVKSTAGYLGFYKAGSAGRGLCFHPRREVFLQHRKATSLGADTARDIRSGELHEGAYGV